MTAERLIAALDENPMERLRFRMLRVFSVLPGSREARKMTDARCLRIAAMLASEQSGRGEDGEAECVNAAFDTARFDDLGRRKGQNSG